METFSNCSLNTTSRNCSLMNDGAFTVPRRSFTVKVVKMSAYVGISLVALLGNIFVIMIICRNKKLRKTINLFILNMAISDLFVPFVFVPMQLYSLYVDAIVATTAWPLGGTAGDVLCKLSMFLADSSPVISIISLVLMTADRFYAVVFPLKAPRVRFKTRVFLLACSWITAFATFAPYFRIMTVREIRGQLTCSLHWPENHQKTMQIYGTILCIVFTIIPFIFLLVMYSVMLMILRKQKIARNHARNANLRRQRNNRNIIFMALAIVIVFAICWGPYNSFIFIATIVWQWKLPQNLQKDIETFLFTVAFLANCNAALNPCIYFIFIQNYRAALRQLCCGGSIPNFSPKNTYSDTNNCHIERQLLARTKHEQGSSDKANYV